MTSSSNSRDRSRLLIFLISQCRNRLLVVLVRRRRYWNVRKVLAYKSAAWVVSDFNFPYFFKLLVKICCWESGRLSLFILKSTRYSSLLFDSLALTDCQEVFDDRSADESSPACGFLKKRGGLATNRVLAAALKCGSYSSPNHSITIKNKYMVI